MHLYTVPLDQSNKYLIYRPLLRLAFVGNRAMADLCRDIAEGDAGIRHLQDSKALGFLKSVHFLQEDPPPPSETPTVFDPTLAVLLLTNRCQLRCVYCYADAGELPEMDLSPELGKAGIDIVCENAQRQRTPYFEVSFHGGGEPTVAWQTMRDCTAYTREKALPARVTLTSNGVWSPNQRQWIMDHLDGVSLSMDGRQQTQDGQRPFLSGEGSFDVVWRNIRAMDEKSFDYAIRLTATDPWENFPKEIEFLSQETGCKHFHVEPTFHIQRGTHGDPLSGEGKGFVESFLQAVDVADGFGRTLMYSGARLGLLTDTFCTAPYQALVVNPLGHLVSCYELAGREHPMNAISVIGQLKQSEIFLDETRREHLHQLLRVRRDACQDCYCYWSCAGDCYVRALPSPDADVNLRRERCAINRGITQGLLLRQIAKGNGVWYAPYRSEIMVDDKRVKDPSDILF